MKKVISGILSLAVVLSLSCSALAVESPAGPNGAAEATSEQIAAAQVTTPKIADEDFQAMLASSVNTRASWITTPLTYYGQETSMSCGPASVRMSLKTLTGTTYSESEVRNGTGYSSTNGTYLADLVSYMNKKQDITDYQAVYGTDKTTLMDCIYYGVYDFSLPIIGVVESSSYGFPYNGSGGHFVVAYGVYSDSSKVQIADPWAGYVDDSENQTYTLTANNIYSGYKVRNIGMCY